METKSMNRCRSCGDAFEPSLRQLRLENRGMVLHDEELSWCLACADEIFRGIVNIKPARLHSDGSHAGLTPRQAMKIGKASG